MRLPAVQQLGPKSIIQSASDGSGSVCTTNPIYVNKDLDRTETPTLQQIFLGHCGKAGENHTGN